MEFSNAWLIMSPACWYKCRVWGFACGTASSWYAPTVCLNFFLQKTSDHCGDRLLVLKVVCAFGVCFTFIS